MAVLTLEQQNELLSDIFAGHNRDGIPINYTKPPVRAAVQAIETWFELPATKQAVSQAIDAASTPFVFTNAQKKRLVAYYLKLKFKLEGV